MPSRLKIVTVPSTPGNSVTTMADPPDGHLYRLIGFKLSLQNDATVASRNLWVKVAEDVSGHDCQPQIVCSALTANQGGSWSFGACVPPMAGTALVTDNLMATTSSNAGLLIDPVVQLTIGVTNGVAGDAYTGHLLLEEIAP